MNGKRQAQWVLGRIDLSQVGQVAAWPEALHVSEHELHDAVAAVGVRARAVIMHLLRKPRRSEAP